MNHQTVYSTNQGDLRRSIAPAPVEQPPQIQQKGTVRVRRETGGRQGKTVTLIYDVPVSPSVLEQLAGDLKRACGTGGTVKDRVIEIQGDKLEPVMQLLTKRGFQVKKTGG
jgi:translation initiation factor 1